jgi:hypothetical protein
MAFCFKATELAQSGFKTKKPSAIRLQADSLAFPC